MNLDVQFRPDWSSAPGETIVDFLQEHNLGVQDFAERMGQSVSDATDLLQGRTPITVAVARQLSSVCGASVEFWMSRDLQYRDDTARVQAADDEWLRELPIGDMVDFGWLAPPRQAEDRISACLRFFNAPTVRACRQAYGAIQEMAAFRTSPSFPSLQAPVAVWLRRGELEAAAIACESWDPEGLRASLPAVRSLTRRKDPQVFLPDLQDVCAGSGVAVTVVRAPNGCRASGASRFVSPEKAVLQFSFR